MKEIRQNHGGDENDKSTKRSDSDRSSHKGPPPWHYPYKQGEASSSNDVEKPKQVIEATSGVKVRHENNDLPQKIEDIVIEHFKPDHGMFRDCRVASVRDFEALADKLHRALKARKSPERVYRVLYFLLREDKAIEKLENALQKKDGTNLETALTEHFGEGTPELKYALELLGKEDVNADQTIQRRPRTKKEGMALAKRLHDALLQGDFETIYRALTPFQRNTASLYVFNDCYKRYKQQHTLNIVSQEDINGLQADIKQYLAGYPLRFGLFLIGDEEMETKVVSPSEAERLAKVALEQTFDLDGNGKRVRVPHEYTDEGCTYRAYIISEAFKELGYGVEKVVAHFVYTSKHRGLRGGLVNPDNPEIHWDFHIACCIRVKTDFGTEIRIFDRSGDLDQPKQLWTVEEWIKRMGQDPSSCKITTFEEWREEVEKRREPDPSSCKITTFEEWRGEVERRCEQDPNIPYPTDLPYIFTTSRNYLDAPSALHIKAAENWRDIPDQYAHIMYNHYGKNFMIDATNLAPYHLVNYSICNEMLNKTIQNDQDTQKFLSTINAKFKASKEEFYLEKALSTRFLELFPHTYERFIKHLRKRGLSPTVIHHFKEYLSPDTRQGRKLRARKRRKLVL